ncbi:unknown [[Mannheimia] succiniciproducens MBEL55E]|uniref:Uncharacterized protein n=1 Tax=Mannheimia succiniciproducens (strain KCTC 0769BP / MBEL55E) TaxID=221988 RepID=Q65VF1_MANSM|nr:unknown [[Mannheimia] succiniciproducens MBEL55E]
MTHTIEYIKDLMKKRTFTVKNLTNFTVNERSFILIVFKYLARKSAVNFRQIF